jgi:hypothetical protein
VSLSSRLKTWWYRPAWSRWYIVNQHCQRCSWPHALRRNRGDEVQAKCANCELPHPASKAQEESTTAALSANEVSRG